MESLWQWGIDLIQTIQMVHGPALDAFFKAITFLGEEEFFLILLPLFFWCVDFAVGIRLTCAFLISAYLNAGLKELFAHPRPFELDSGVQLHPADGYGLPSGHSQSSVVVWGTIAVGFRRKWLWGVAILLMALIGFSRVYLGVHFPTDVLAGWAVGAALLAIYLAVEPRVEAWLGRAELAAQLALTVGGPLLLLILCPVEGAISPAAVLMGMGIGGVWCVRLTRFSAGGPVGQRIARFLVGVAVLLGLYIGLKLIFPAEGEPFYLVLRSVRYALLGLWVSLGAPWLFLKLRLASRA